MATFQTQVMGLTSLSISSSGTTPTEAELTEFLKDGVIDVTNRWLLVKPQDVEEFQRESATIASNGGFETKGAQIISVIREAGADGSSDGSTAWEVCRKVSASMQSKVVDTESLFFASKYNPVYTIIDYNKLHVYPVPDNTDDGFKVFYVNNIPTDQTNGASLAYSHSNIKYFPNDKVYLVVLYAGMRSLQAKMGATTITDLSVSPVPPDVQSISSTSVSFGQAAPVYSSGTVVGFGGLLKTLADLSISAVPPDTPSNPNITSSGLSTVSKPSIAASAPAYTVKTITGQTSFNNYWTLADFGDSDPGSLSVSAVPPDTPSLTAIAFSSLDADLDAALPTYSTATVSAGGVFGANTLPAYTKPTATGGAGLVGMETGTIADATDQIEFDTWWDTLGDLIETQEDTELAAAQLQKIQAYIQAYSIEMQNELNEFNKENVRFQANVQEGMQELQVANQRNIAAAQGELQKNIDNENRSQQRHFQNAVNDMKVIFDTNAQAIQKYNSELQSYQAEVNSQVQEQGQNLQRYQAELTTVYQAWAKTESDNIQKFQLDTQNELNEFNKENAVYQADLKIVLAKLQADAAELQAEGAQDFQAVIQDYTLELQKYQADIATYQAEVNTEVQEWQASTNAALKQHAQSMQDNLNVFNEDNAVYQAQLQVSLATAKFDTRKTQENFKNISWKYSHISKK